jgi:hypothetical protein
MADTVINNREEVARERVVEERPTSGLGLIIGIIAVIAVLLLLFGGGLFRGTAPSPGGGTTGGTGSGTPTTAPSTQ